MDKGVYDGFVGQQNIGRGTRRAPKPTWGVQSSGTDQDLSNQKLSESEIDTVKRVHALEKDVREIKEILKGRLGLDEAPSNIIDLRSIPYEQAKTEIAKYFMDHDGEEIGYDELIEGLGIEPDFVVRACAELEEEGKIG